MNPKTGVEVVGLTEWPVARYRKIYNMYIYMGLIEFPGASYREIDERIETATKNRTVAATQMNATSSRAHTVVTICYTQLELNAQGPGKHSEKKAKMNLVDLAGSERAESTGATGDRLKVRPDGPAPAQSVSPRPARTRELRKRTERVGPDRHARRAVAVARPCPCAPGAPTRHGAAGRRSQTLAAAQSRRRRGGRGAAQEGAANSLSPIMLGNVVRALWWLAVTAAWRCAGGCRH